MVVQRIQLTGNYTQDFAEANRLAGFADASVPDSVAAKAHESLRLPGTDTGYVWHHVEDVDVNKYGTLILVRKDKHNVNHTGGAAVYRDTFDEEAYP